MQRGVEIIEAVGQLAGLPGAMGYLAEALGWAGRIEEGLAWLDRAEALGRATGERQLSAELWRIRGELLAQTNHSDPTPEYCFQQAIALALAQQARTWEARARDSYRVFAR